MGGSPPGWSSALGVVFVLICGYKTSLGAGPSPGGSGASIALCLSCEFHTPLARSPRRCVGCRSLPLADDIHFKHRQIWSLK